MLLRSCPIPLLVSFPSQLDFNIDQPSVEPLLDREIDQQICISKIEFIESCSSFVFSWIDEFDYIFSTSIPFKDQSTEDSSAVSMSCTSPGRRRSRNSMVREAVDI